MRVQEDRSGGAEPLLSDDVQRGRRQATGAEALVGAPTSARRATTNAAPASPVQRPRALPRRPGYRRMRARRGRVSRHCGARCAKRCATTAMCMPLRRLKRRLRQRRILLLIDVSGSMKERTETHLRIAHALAHAVERIEVFTFGTRLTRVTRAMRLRNREQALAPRPAAIVSDWDGGTRIGDALQAFLGVPRFAGYRARRRWC